MPSRADAIQAGKLRRRLLIEKPTETQDSFNDAVQAWSFVASVWGSIEPLSGQELFQARFVQADVSHKVTIRYFRGLNSKWRFRYMGRVFNISSVVNTTEQQKKLVCICKEVA